MSSWSRRFAADGWALTVPWLAPGVHVSLKVTSRAPPAATDTTSAAFAPPSFSSIVAVASASPKFATCAVTSSGRSPASFGAPGSPTFHDQFRYTPFADTLTLDVALATMTEHGLGLDETPDVLAVGFSATDYIGHAYGPESHEIMDQMLRLDLVIGRLIEAAEARVGRDRALFVLSADHGVMPLVESLQKRGIAAKRVIPAELRAAVTTALTQRFPGKQDLVANASAPDFYLNLDAIARHGLRRADVEKAIGDALMATGVVAKIYTASSFAGEAPSVAEDPYFDAVRRSYFGPRSPHVIARLKEHMYLTSSRGGTGHGSPYDYDSHVPLMFMGHGIRPGAYPGDTGPEDIAPTLGAFLGVDYPLQDGRRRLTEMLQP